MLGNSGQLKALRMLRLDGNQRTVAAPRYGLSFVGSALVTAEENLASTTAAL